jgi:hypothetical protein
MGAPAEDRDLAHAHRIRQAGRPAGSASSAASSLDRRLPRVRCMTKTRPVDAATPTASATTVTIARRSGSMPARARNNQPAKRAFLDAVQLVEVAGERRDHAERADPAGRLDRHAPAAQQHEDAGARREGQQRQQREDRGNRPKDHVVAGGRDGSVHEGPRGRAGGALLTKPSR